MTKEELKQEAEEYAKGLCKTCTSNVCRFSTIKTCMDVEVIKQSYLASAEPREKHIAELEAYNEKLFNGDIDKHNKIVGLEMQIEKMKNELHQRVTSHYNCDSDLLDKIVGLDRLWQFGQEF